jgi:hypothetical protein
MGLEGGEFAKGREGEKEGGVREWVAETIASQFDLIFRHMAILLHPLYTFLA